MESKLDNPPLDICDNINFDIVAAKIGNNWRLPSLSDFEKLEKYCDYEWTTDYDIAGMEFVSRINGQSIFFPALGLRAGNPGRVYGGGLGCYWTGTLNKYKEPYYFILGEVVLELSLSPYIMVQTLDLLVMFFRKYMNCVSKRHINC